MKKFTLKALNFVGHMAVSAGAGYLFGRLLGWIFSKLLTEEMAESHPYAFLGLFLLMWILLVGWAICWGFVWPATKVYNWIDSKIEDSCKKEVEDEEWE